jgi:GH15 family glucan-1,4-alpha-glucosidase
MMGTMALPIEDYALISDCYTGALVGRDGSIDWLCLPLYDSPSIFASLLGTQDHGHWSLAPSDPDATLTRHYDDHTMTLVSHWVTATGEVEVTDLMPHGEHRADVVRRIRGLSGAVELLEQIRIRFDYANALPWVRKYREEKPTPLVAMAGPDAIILRGPEMKADGTMHEVAFTVRQGETVDLVMTWFASHKDPPPPLDVTEAIRKTDRWWRQWSARFKVSGEYAEETKRSLLLLRALTHDQTGGIMAAVTTSLPEAFGGNRNWDYRYVWLRDASLTLTVLLDHGYHRVAEKWRRWIMRAVAGDPADVQIMYGLAGERRLNEEILDTLPGYQGASPVRIGNAASTQFQADVIGEVMVGLHDARVAGIKETHFSWALQRALMAYLEKRWEKPDQGIWEMRGPAHVFTHSRAMVWAAFDRAVRAVREFGLDGPVEHWEEIRDRVRQTIEHDGFDATRGTYTQYFGTTEVDASLLQLPQVGYCAPDDPRMLGTVKAIEEDLLDQGLPRRYRTTEAENNVDGLTGREHPFLACAFWLVEQYAKSGRTDDAHSLMNLLLSFSNDVGMFSEEYDVDDHRQAGNTPQALTHLALVRAADAIRATV